MRNKFLLCNFIFVSALLVLFLNDHFLKIQFHNWITGKLSDFAGIMVLPFLLAFIFPKLREGSVWMTAIFFIFWKSPYSEGFINFYNNISPISIYRIVDYTDLLSLIFLIIPYFLIKNKELLKPFEIKNFSPAFVFIPSIFILMSTSPPHHYRYYSNTGNVKFVNFDIVIDGKEKEKLINDLSKRNIFIHKDTARIINSEQYRLLNGHFEQKNLQSKSELYKINQDSLKSFVFKRISESNYYIIDSLKIDDESIKNIRFYMYDVEDKKKGKSTGLNIESLNSGKNLSDKKVERKLKKMYRAALKEKFSYN